MNSRIRRIWATAVVTTFKSQLQEAAYDALGNYKGAVVDGAEHGKILAMVSKPDFDPKCGCRELGFPEYRPDSALLNRATQGQYAPGSTFKVVTALEYMRESGLRELWLQLYRGHRAGWGDHPLLCNGHVHGQVGLPGQSGLLLQYLFFQHRPVISIKNFRGTSKDRCLIPKLPSVLPYSKSSFSLEPGQGARIR